MKRREAIEQILLNTMGLTGLGLVAGCRTIGLNKLNEDGTIAMKDLLIMRLDYKTGTEVKDQETEERIVLPAANIRDGKIFEFVWREKRHEHTVLVDHSNYSDLVHGLPTVVISSFLNNHDHKFVIAPKVVDSASQEIETARKQRKAKIAQDFWIGAIAQADIVEFHDF